MKNKDLEKRYKEVEEQSNSVNFEKLQQEKLAKQHRSDLDRVQKLLADKEQELDNERSLNQLEIQAA